MKLAAIAVVVSAIGNAVAFRESLQGSAAFWLWILGPTLLLALLSLRVMWNNGTLVDRFTPRWGDLSIGALTASVLLVASWVARGALSPSGTTRQSWLYRVYLQLGDPETLQNSALLTGCLLLTAAAEEVVWRGMVLDSLAERKRTRPGMINSAQSKPHTVYPT
jgi:membrane protease YdiL (CAAX protease family)